MYPRIRVILGVVASLSLWSCAQSPKAADSVVPAVPHTAAAPPIENRLNSPAFRTLPAEARDYLERLSHAFSAQDEAFLRKALEGFRFAGFLPLEAEAVSAEERGLALYRQSPLMRERIGGILREAGLY